MWSLMNTVRHYPWGSRTVIPELLGETSPADRPYAELWMGAHPDAPSVLSTGTPLDKAIEEQPDALLGAAVHERFGTRLPFLMKVLAAEQPLSLQAHPTNEQAQAGFAAEEAAGVPRDDPTRTFKDPFHKPELLLALTTFEALCGFRPVEESLHCLAKLQVPELKPTIAALARGGLRAAIPQVIALSPEQRAVLVSAVAEAASRFVAAHDPEFINTYGWAASLAETYPGDPGVVISLMCNHLKLSPGEAVFLPAGNLHAYLSGAGVEVMAGSDNVLRGGLTPKHVSVPELSRVLDFRTGPIPVLQGETQGSARLYRTPAAEFELQSFRIVPAEPASVTDRRGPEIVICEHGQLTLECASEALTLTQGQSLFIAAAEPAYVIRGEGRLFRASIGRG